MNLSPQRFRVPVAGTVVRATCAVLVGFVASAHAADATCEPAASLHQRIVARADQGIGSLRNFAWMTERIYGVEMIDIAQSLDAWRAAGCVAQVAQSAQATPVPHVAQASQATPERP